MASVDVSPSISFHLFLQLAKVLLGSCFSSWVLEDREGGEKMHQKQKTFNQSLAQVAGKEDLSWCDSVSGVDPPLEAGEEGP